MSDEVNVAPSPIQRNILDVATELTQLYYSSVTPSGVEEIQQTYAKMFAIATITYANRSKPTNLKELIPETLKNKL